MRRIYKKLCITGLALVTLMLAGCRNTKTANEYIDLSQNVSAEVPVEEDDIAVTVFYQDEYGYIVPVDTVIPWTEGVAKAVIRKMMNTQELQQELVIMGLESLIPQEASINGIDIQNGLAKIDFNTDKLSFKSEKKEKNFVDGVVLALTSFPTVKTVQFMFNGHVIETLPHGTRVWEPISAVDINPAMTNKNGEAVSVFYHQTSSTKYDYFVPVTVYLKNANMFSALEHLINTPAEALKSGIPSGTKLIDVKTIGDTVCIFFNESFNELKKSTVAEENAAMKSIVLTVGQFDGEKRIKIYAGDKEYVPFEGIDTGAFANIG